LTMIGSNVIMIGGMTKPDPLGRFGVLDFGMILDLDDIELKWRLV
jgi:hypothetical protein